MLPGLNQTQADPRAAACLGMSFPIWGPWTPDTCGLVFSLVWGAREPHLAKTQVDI